MKTSLLVIGGGAAGLMAAGTAAHEGVETIVLERNERPGRKLMITGKGRCNVTNTAHHCRNLFPMFRATADFYTARFHALCPPML